MDIIYLTGIVLFIVLIGALAATFDKVKEQK